MSANQASLLLLIASFSFHTTAKAQELASTTYRNSPRDTWTSVAAICGGNKANTTSSPLTSKKFKKTLSQIRSNAVIKAGGAGPYLKSMSPAEAGTFKGFTYEKSLITRLTSQSPDAYF